MKPKYWPVLFFLVLMYTVFLERNDFKGYFALNCNEWNDLGSA